MKRTKIFIILLSLLIFLIPVPVYAYESVEDGITVSNNEISPQALIVATGVRKWSESGNFIVHADIVTNDGTGKIIDIKNIVRTGGTEKMENVEVSLSSGEIWNGGEYATVTITYQYNGSINTDIVKYYPYGQ